MAFLTWKVNNKGWSLTYLFICVPCHSSLITKVYRNLNWPLVPVLQVLLSLVTSQCYGPESMNNIPQCKGLCTRAIGLV